MTFSCPLLVAAPRVRAFAELAFKEIQSVVGSDASLLADKLAFAEYMDKINESVLLGLHKPPPAAIVINGGKHAFDQEEQDSSSHQIVKPNYHEAPSPLLHSFSINTTEADAVASPLEASSWRAVSSLRRHHRPVCTNSALGHSAILSPPSSPCSARLQKVRFDVGAEEKDLCTGKKKFPTSATQQNHNQGLGDDAQDQGLDGPERHLESTREARAPSCDFDGPNVLQDLRRLRFKAVAVVNADDIEPPLHPSHEEAYSHHVLQSRNKLPSPVVGAENGTEFESPTSSPSPSVALPCGEDQTTKRGLMFRRRRENGTFMQAVPEGGHDTAGCSGRDRSSKGEIITIKDGLAGGAVVEWSDGSTGSFARAPVQSLRDGKHVLDASTYDHRRGPADATRRAAAAAGVAGHQGRQFGSGDGGRDVPKQQSRCAIGTGDGCGEERQEEDEVELSLDLSDCSNEKLGSLLEQGRRRGSGRGEPCTVWRSDLGAWGGTRGFLP
ncbi:unnamed protein product [Ectocarpus sp. 4 AP-2014]